MFRVNHFIIQTLLHSTTFMAMHVGKEESILTCLVLKDKVIFISLLKRFWWNYYLFIQQFMQLRPNRPTQENL